MAVYVQGWMSQAQPGIPSELLGYVLGLGALAFSFPPRVEEDDSQSSSADAACLESSTIPPRVGALSVVPAAVPTTDQSAVVETTTTAAFDDLGLRAVAVAFERAFAARGAERGELVESLVASPSDAVLRASLDAYRVRGNSDRLDFAVQILGRMKWRSLPALIEVATIFAPGQAAFVDLVAYAPFVPDELRRALLAALARSPDVETRFRLLRVLEAVRVEVARPPLETLAVDANEEIAESAAAMLVSLC